MWKRIVIEGSNHLLNWLNEESMYIQNVNINRLNEYSYEVIYYQIM